MLVKNTRVNFTYYNMTVLNLFSLWEINVLMGSSRCVCLWLSVGPALHLISAALSLLRRPGPSMVAWRMGLTKISVWKTQKKKKKRMGLTSHCRLPARECSVCLSRGPLEEGRGRFLMFSSLAALPFGSCGRSSLPPTPQLPCGHIASGACAPHSAGEMALSTNQAPVHQACRIGDSRLFLLCHCCCPPSIEGEPGLREAEHDPGYFYN